MAVSTCLRRTQTLGAISWILYTRNVPRPAWSKQENRAKTPSPTSSSLANS